MKKRLVSLMLLLSLCMGLTPARAYTTSDFSDVPRDNWAYAYVMDMADRGLINGVGGGRFDPTAKISAAMLLTLLGRLAFPDLTVEPGDTWYGPYVREADDCGWLDESAVSLDQVEEPISRYDMAAILSTAAQQFDLEGEEDAWVSFEDRDSIPGIYRDAVGLVCSMGLVTGDQNFNFNGRSTMTRSEMAAILSRLVEQVETAVPDGWKDDPALKPTSAPEPTLAPAAGEETESPALENGQAILTIDGTEYTMEARYDPNSGAPAVKLYFQGQTGFQMPYIMVVLGADFAQGETLERSLTLAYWEKWTPADKTTIGAYWYGGTEKGIIRLDAYDPTQATPSLFYLDCTAADDAGVTHTIQGWAKVAVKGKASSGGSSGGITTPGITTPTLSPQRCAVCSGSGICRICHGKGKLSDANPGDRYYLPCNSCINRSGKCRYCDGDGWLYN